VVIKPSFLLPLDEYDGILGVVVTPEMGLEMIGQ
jgi:hypothetical protein